MYNFSLYACKDIAPGIEEMITVCNQFMIGNMEADDEIGGVKLVETKGELLEKYRRLLIRYNKKIVLLNTSLAPGDIDGFKVLFRKALTLGVENIRVNPCMSPPEDKNAASGENALSPGTVAENLEAVCRIGKSYGIGVLVENKADTYFSMESSIAAVFRKMGGHKPGWIFNPLELAKNRVHPFFHIFYNSRLKSSISFLRINDGLFTDGRPELPGQGNAEIKEMTSALLARGFKGYFSFIPYFEGMRIEDYTPVMDHFKRLLMEM